jgi:plasmid stabilization system protein ParE
MAIKTVVWTDTAACQRRKILKYWTKRNKSSAYSIKLIHEISEKIQFILKNPEASTATNLIDIRTSTLGNYNIFYKTTKKDLIVVAFWDNRQNPKKLLQIIKKS